jgi:hypothetical protein
MDPRIRHALVEWSAGVSDLARDAAAAIHKAVYEGAVTEPDIVHGLSMAQELLGRASLDAAEHAFCDVCGWLAWASKTFFACAGLLEAILLGEKVAFSARAELLGAAVSLATLGTGCKEVGEELEKLPRKAVSA